MATTPYNPLVPQLSYGDAAATHNALSRQAFADWLNTFMRYEDRLVEFANDPTQAATAMQNAQQTVAGSFDRQAQATERQLRPFGPLNADEQKVAERTLALSRATASADAQNRARDLTLARQQAVLGNPAAGAL